MPEPFAYLRRENRDHQEWQPTTLDELGKNEEFLQQIIADYLFTDQKPMPDVIIKMLERKPKVLERRPIIERITQKILSFVDVFITGIGEY